VHLLVQIVLVSTGSMLGGLARWGVSVAFARLLGTAFPWRHAVHQLDGLVVPRVVLPRGFRTGQENRSNRALVDVTPRGFTFQYCGVKYQAKCSA
jgi:hypothetical protein